MKFEIISVCQVRIKQTTKRFTIISEISDYIVVFDAAKIMLQFAIKVLCTTRAISYVRRYKNKKIPKYFRMERRPDICADRNQKWQITWMFQCAHKDKDRIPNLRMVHCVSILSTCKTYDQHAFFNDFYVGQYLV